MPVLEAWTILSAAAVATERITVGPFVVNVMNRHPAVLARMASTLQIASGGRLVLGIGIGGAPQSTRRTASTSPSRRPARPGSGDDRGYPRALDRRSGDARRRRTYPSRTPTPSRSPSRPRRSSSAARRRPGSGSPRPSATAGPPRRTSSSTWPRYLEALAAAGRKRRTSASSCRSGAGGGQRASG